MLGIEALEKRVMMTTASGDFNGDGIDDLAIGAPYENTGGVSDCGAVTVIYGRSGTGLQTIGDQFWTQGRSDIREENRQGDHFGEALAVGDFNHDGYDDLAIGIPGEKIGLFNEDAGKVLVLYGSRHGLSSVGHQIWSQHSDGIKGDPESGDQFGKALAAGDFDGDGFDDLAIGVPFEDIETEVGGWVVRDIHDAGYVNVIRGSRVGLTARGDYRFHQSLPDLLDSAEEGDRFGWALAVGDFNADGRDDLAIGVPNENLGRAHDAGAVHVIYGSRRGLDRDQIWTQANPDIIGHPQRGDRFGWSLSVGNFNGDGHDDLAIGAPDEDIGRNVDAGAVHLIFGSRTGLTAVGNQLWHQDSRYIEGMAERGDHFGYSLSAGNYNGDWFDDLAIGVPGEDINTLGVGNAGAVNVIFGSRGGLTSRRDQIWHQDIRSILDDPEHDDLFGATLTSGDFDGDGRSDLAIGVPGESVYGIARAGAVSVLYGSPLGLSALRDEIWHAGISGLHGDDVAVGDYFGGKRITGL
jgi:hypothetical protein